MPRLLALLLMFALTFGNGAAVATAICQHHDAREHGAALLSADAAVAAVALSEERAVSTAEKEGMLADGGAASLLGFVIPLESGLVLRAVERTSAPTLPTARLASLSPPPLLRPPLA